MKNHQKTHFHYFSKQTVGIESQNHLLHIFVEHCDNHSHATLAVKGEGGNAIKNSRRSPSD